MASSDRYEPIKDIGSGNFGVAKLYRDKRTREMVAVKLIERGEKVSQKCSIVLVKAPREWKDTAMQTFALASP